MATDGVVYSGIQKDTLTITKALSSYAGYCYRCIVKAGNVTDTSDQRELHIVNRWTGSVSTAWETAGNWSCGVVPDSYTDVIIENGATNKPLVSSKAFCKSLSLRDGARLSVGANCSIDVSGKVVTTLQ